MGPNDWFKQNKAGSWRLGGVREKPQGAFQMQGQEGSQSGPAQESDLMTLERQLQAAAGYGLGGASGLGAFMSGPIGAPVGAAGLVGGANTVRNADEPNIRDVWMDQIRRKYMQGQ